MIRRGVPGLGARSYWPSALVISRNAVLNYREPNPPCNRSFSNSSTLAYRCSVRPPFLQLLAALVLLTPQLSCAAPSSTPQITELLRILNKDPEESKRLDAFKKLEALSAFDAQQLSRSITDTSANVRAYAVRLGETLAANDPELELRLLALAYDRTSIVRLQMLATLPSFHHPQARAALLSVLTAEVENPKSWPLALNALKPWLWLALETLTAEPLWKKESPGRSRFLELAGNAIRETTPGDELNSLLVLVSDESARPRWLRLALLRGVLAPFNPADKSTPLTRVHFSKMPPAIRTLLNSKDTEFHKLLKSPPLLLSWPDEP